MNEMRSLKYNIFDSLAVKNVGLLQFIGNYFGRLKRKDIVLLRLRNKLKGKVKRKLGKLREVKKIVVGAGRIFRSSPNKFLRLKQLEFLKIMQKVRRLNKLERLDIINKSSFSNYLKKFKDELIRLDKEKVKYNQIRKDALIVKRKKRLAFRKWKLQEERRILKYGVDKEKELKKQVKHRKGIVKKMSKFTKMLITNLFLGSIVRKGKRLFAEKIMLNIFFNLRKELSLVKEKGTPLYVFLLAVENVKPLMKLRSKTIGGMVYRLPKQASEKELYQLAIRWIIGCAKERSYEKGFCKKLTGEIFDSYKGKSEALVKRAQLHKSIVDARPFLKYL